MSARDWQGLFVQQRQQWAQVRIDVFGHALFEKALSPYVGMTGHALLIETTDRTAGDDLDVVAADAVLGSITQPRDLSPLPVLGVPGWWDANRNAAFYANTAYFRPGRSRESGSAHR